VHSRANAPTAAGPRRAGLLVPLFSCASSASWGIGDIGDLVPMARWLAGAGLTILQLLPINEMAPGDQSPYSAISAMAIDPLFISVPAVEEFQALGGEAALDADERAELAEVRRSPRIEYAAVRRLKGTALRRAFDHFAEVEWRHDTARARALRAFVTAQAWWVEEYALFRAIHAREGERPWTDWPEGLQRRDPAALDRVRRELAHDVLLYQYLQWIADMQWRAARAGGNGVALFGDLPFMVDSDSADVWAGAYQFNLDGSVGAPPDAFSATGQNWGLPVYQWDVMAGEDFRWLRERARRSADLFGGYRIDHLVGFYRTFVWPKDGSDPFFTPDDEASQTALGERVLALMRESGATIVAEDLGTVPDFVRESLARLRVPGFRVLRWERLWNEPGQPFRDPLDYPPNSVATSGTHDTEPMAVWWERAGAEERAQVAALPLVGQLAKGGDLVTAPYMPTVRDALVEALFASASDLLLLPIQDAFGWRERINEPATVRDDNWTYRLPWPVDRFDDQPDARACQRMLRQWAVRYGRCRA
jgi:4-alpha-glucanotransferase